MSREKDTPEEIATTYVAEGFFETLAAAALHGRTIERSDHVDGSHTVVVLSYGAWRRRYGADPSIVGETISLSGRAFTILGVMRPGFEYPHAATEMWAPLLLIPDTGVPRRRFIRWLSVIARLKPGVSIESARAEMATITGRLAQEYPDSNEGLTAATIEPLHAQMVGEIRAGMLTIPGRPGHEVPPDGQEPAAAMRFTSPNYFRTMRIPLLSGISTRWTTRTILSLSSLIEPRRSVIGRTRILSAPLFKLARTLFRSLASWERSNNCPCPSRPSPRSTSTSNKLRVSA